MRIKESGNPFAVDATNEEEQKFVLVENCWDEELGWEAKSRYSDIAGESKKVAYFWKVGDLKRMEEDYAKAIFGNWAIPQDEYYLPNWTEQMLKQLSKWPSPTPPWMKIYAELADGEQGDLLYDTEVAWHEWMKDRGQIALPTRRKGLPAGTAVPEMPAKLAEMDHAALIAFSKEVKFPVPEDWPADTMREVLFTYAPASMLKDAIERTQEKLDGVTKKEKVDNRKSVKVEI